MSRFGCVTPSEGLDVTDRKACFLSLLAQAPVWLFKLRVSQHFSTFYGSSVQAMNTQLDALPILPVLARGVSGCVNSAFLDILRLICSVHGYPTQRAANTTRPRSYRLWLLELRVSRHFSTFYGPSVQSMDTQLGARHRRRTPTIHRGRAQRTTSAGSVVVASWEKMVARE